ncbi:hypothetical protein [Saccharicrinis sp. GN24d3]|uniref:hypothetical protein n=1 Tax=Saccharicrinis sp. GN24d3 TaxID=3458416 RepID=UPI0040373544
MAKAPSKRFGILLTTSLFIILAMTLYYIYTQNVKETKVKRQAFKVLYRYASDLSEKEKAIRAQYQEPIMIELSGINKAIHDKTRRKNSIRNNMLKLQVEFNSEDLKQQQLAIKHQMQSVRQEFAPLSNDLKELLRRKEELEAAFRTHPSKLINKEDWYLLKGIPYQVWEEDTSEFVYIRSEQLFGDVFNIDLFENFVVFNNDSIVFKTLEALNDLQLIMDEDKGLVQDSIQDKGLSAFTFAKKTQYGGHGITNPSENQVKINIAGEDYQAFIVPVQSVGMSHLVGLVPNNKYASMKRGFDRGVISAITVFIVLLLLSIPVVKLMVITPGEAFTIKSLVTLLFSVAGIMFLILFFSVYISNKIFIRSHINADGEHLQSLSLSIKDAFDNEISSMLNQLDTFTNILSDTNLLRNTKLKKGANLLTHGESFNAIDEMVQRKIKEQVVQKIDSGPYPTWLEAFTASTKDKKTVFVVENGKEWKESPWGIDISKRDYIQNTRRFNKNGKYFGFQSIFSLNTAKPQVVVSQEIDTTEYAVCISAEMHTVNDVVLPYGYSFCIIDKTGKVWFHENPRNNLRENLFEETDHFPLLEAVVKSRRSNTISCDYKMKSTLMRIDPLDADMGLFLVTMCGVNDYYQIFHQSGYMILGSALLIFAFWFLLALVYRWYQKVRNSSRYRPHSLLYFFPENDSINSYLRLIVVNVLYLVIFIAITLVFYEQVYVNHWVRLIGLTGAVLLILNIREVRESNNNFSFFSFAKFLFTEIVAFFFIEYLLGGNQASRSMGISVLLLIVLNLFFFIGFRIKHYGKVSKKWCFNIYFAYIFTLGIATIFLPLFTVYTVVYHQESIMHFMHQQRHVADKLIQRDNRFMVSHKPSVTRELDKKGRYFDIIHGLEQNDDLDSIGAPGNLLSTLNYVKMFGDIRSGLYFVNNKIEDRGNLIKPNYTNSADGLYTYAINDKTLFLKVRAGGYPYYQKALTLEMESFGVFDLPKRYYGFGIGLLLAFLLYAFYFPKIGYYLFPRLKYSRDLFTGNPVVFIPKQGAKRYMVCLPDKELFDHVLKTDNAELFALEEVSQQNDFVNYNKSGKDIYLFCQERAFDSLKALDAFVFRLEKLMNDNLQRSITFVCFKTPGAFIEGLHDRLRTEDDKHFAKLDAVINRLQNILSEFAVRYSPILSQALPKELLQKSFEGQLNWLNNEMGNNAYLRSQFEELDTIKSSFSVNQIEGDINDDNVYVVYVTFKNYYRKIWDNCTQQEKSVLFDIAEDHMINLNKEGVVNELINKGLIKKERYLSLFNLSFTHFVLHQQKQIEVINRSLRESYKSGWSQYNMPIKLLAAAILIFLFITQQEFLNGIQSILISVGAVLTVAARFINNPLKSGNNPVL